ncbi:hypothetical protein BH11PLA2_BH11PLA2_51660 [soil metagenome]
MAETNRTQEAIQALRHRGFAVCKIDRLEKKPTYKGWPTFSKEPADFGPHDPVGIVAGPISAPPGHALVIIDLDSAAAVQKADKYLPITGMIEGRASKPRSHRYYFVPTDNIPESAWSQCDSATVAREQHGHPGPFIKSFRDANKSEVFRFIGTGGQAVCPPSTHESGQVREWVMTSHEQEIDEPGLPYVVDFVGLWGACTKLAKATGATVPDLIEPKQQQQEQQQEQATGSTFKIPVTGDNDERFLEQRAIWYLEKNCPAISGQGGSNALLWAARVIVYGFDLGVARGKAILQQYYNPRCKPEWTEKEIDHKCKKADTNDFDKPRGWLRDTPNPNAKPEAKSTSSTNTATNSDARDAYNKAGYSLDFVKLSTLKARAVKWHIPARIPRGMFTLLASYGGLGKSTLTRHIIANTTTGRCAFGITYETGGPGEVIMLAAEDSYEETVVPHLVAEGADLSMVSQVFHVKTEPDSRKTRVHVGPEHIMQLREELKLRPNVRLIVIDPVATFAAKAGINDAKAAEVRRVLDPIANLAQETGIAVIVIAHFNKGLGRSAADRIAGSRAYVDTARLAYVIDKNPEDEEQRLLMPVKSNVLGIEKEAAVFKLRGIEADTIETVRQHPAMADLDEADFREITRHMCRLEFGNNVTVSPDDVVGGGAKSANKDPNKVEKCRLWLMEFLKDYAYPSREIVDAAARKRFTFDNVKEAKLMLKADGLKSSKSASGEWWSGFGGPDSWRHRPEGTDASDTADSPLTPDSPLSPLSLVDSLSSLSLEEGNEGKEVEQGKEGKEGNRMSEADKEAIDTISGLPKGCRKSQKPRKKRKVAA